METKSIWFVAFLQFEKRVYLKELRKNNENKTVFFFDIPLTDWTKYKLEFNASKYCGYKNEVENIRDLVH